MCILCELKKEAAQQTEARPELTLSELAKHARNIVGEKLHPVKAIAALAFLTPVMKDPELMLELLVKADDEVNATKQPRTSGVSEGSSSRIEELEKENARLQSQVNLQNTNGKAMADALAALSLGMKLQMPELDGSNPAATVEALSVVADKLDQHKGTIEFWMREITNRYDLNKVAAH